jgi:hypothetical protein
MTKAPSSIMYSSVGVSRGSIRLAFLIAALNDLDIMSCDLEDALTLMLHAEKSFGSKVESIRNVARTTAKKPKRP